MKLRLSLPMLVLLGVVTSLGAGVLATRSQRAGAAPPLPLPASARAADPAPAAAATDFVLTGDARGVTTAPAKVERLADYLEIPGRIQADPTRVVHVYPPVSGRLLAVDVRPADPVAEGQVVAVLASSDVALARAAWRQAAADAQVKRQEADRAEALYAHHVIAQRDLQEAQANAAEAAATLASAAERLQLLGVDTAAATDRLEVRAPRAGLVTDVGAAPGEYAKSLDNANPLCTIADLGTVWAVGGVYEQDLASVAVGDSADVIVAAYPATRWRGRITAIASTEDTTTRTLQVRVVLPNRGLVLKPDLFATIRVVRAVRTAVVVPAAAVVRDGGASYVFVQRGPGRYAHRVVALGRDAGPGEVEVTSGLAPGEIVVVEGAELLGAAATAS